ncbi:hypothetical protein GY45DRAFT_120196 [Cubamyces sp. BRFM 1775]|nr:hypothetical protein GY45DRAFT_120196 [Cubamyces sp. BRFM 1775]
MVATFILTRTFAISALLVGAFSSAYAAPVVSPRNSVDTTNHGKRWCRQMGCLVEIPPEASSSATPASGQLTYASVPTAAATAPEYEKEEATSSPDRLAGDGAEAVFAVEASPATEDVSDEQTIDADSEDSTKVSTANN